MTKKDYVRLANRISHLDEPFRTHAAYAVADVCSGDNGSFDRKRFYQACKIKEVQTDERS